MRVDTRPAPAARYRIRLARPEEVPRMREIEDEAAALFLDVGLVAEAQDPAFPEEELARLVAMGQVWVACLEDDRAVGMVIVSVRDGAAYVEEMDVVPEHGKRGLGTRLLAQVCAWAGTQGHAAVALSTLRDVPWNAPFYRKHGFRELAPSDWSPSMHDIHADEARRGLRVEDRVFMRCDLCARLWQWAT